MGPARMPAPSHFRLSTQVLARTPPTLRALLDGLPDREKPPS